MKRIISLIGLLLIIQHTSARPQWQWGVNSNCTSEDWGSVIATDKAGNVYVSGIFTNTITLDTITLTSLGAKDVFLAKYDPSGQIIWAKSCGSIAEETIRAISIDSSDNIYLTGSFGAHVTYPVTYTDTAYFSGTSVISNGNEDIFLAKYDSNGQIIWVKNYGSVYDDVGASITVTGNQKILLTGTFGNYGGSPPVYGTARFDSLQTVSAGDGDIFLACIQTNGTIQWVKKFGTKSSESGIDVSADSQNNIYLTGQFDYSISFQGLTANSISSGFVGGDVFLAKFDSVGNALWAKPIGGSNSSTSNGGSVWVSSLVSTTGGDIYVTGSYDFCTLKFHNNATLPFQSQFQVFLAKYDTQGNLIWAREMGGPSWDFSNDLWLDKNENVYLTGFFRNWGVFDKDTIYGYGMEDAFITKWDKNGNELWAVNMGGSGYDYGSGITGDDASNIYVTGAFNSGSFNYGGSTLTNSGSWDMFLVKLSDPTSVEELNTSAYEVQVYPNPTSDVLNIHSSKKLFNEVSIYDPLGRLAFHEKTEKQKDKTSIHLGHLPEGIYYLQLSGVGNPQTKKIIIQH